MGVTKTVYEEGTGPSPQKGNRILMHYTGWLKDDSQPEQKGKKFDSSVDRDEPFDCNIGIGQLIKGWDQGVPEMKVGEKARLDITSDFGYGARGAGKVIPPNADLIFDVELLKIF
ncbi:fkbp-type peptidyl-prolyl cis-trans isomerase [Trichoderma evansii]